MQNAINHALPIVAAAYGRKFGVHVQVGGTQAATNGKTIRIPEISDNPAARTLAWGYLTHEAAHVRHTDFERFDLTGRQGALVTYLVNVLEDVRIEAAMIRDYPGTATTLWAVEAFLIREGHTRLAKVTDQPAQIMAGFVYTYCRRRVLRWDGLDALALQNEQVLRKTFPATFVHRLLGLLTEVSSLDSTGGAADLAQRIVALIGKEAEPPPPPSKPLPGADEDEPEVEAPEDEGDDHGTGEDQSEESDEEGVDPEGTPDDDDEAGQSGGDGKDQGEASEAGDDLEGAPGEDDEAGPSGRDDKDQDEESEAGDDPEGTPGEDDAAGPSGEGSDDQGDASDGDQDPVADRDDGDEGNAQPAGDGADGEDETGRKALQAVLSAGANALPKDPFETVAKAIAQQSRGTSTVLLPTLEDYAGHATHGTAALARVRAESAKLTARLQGLVQAHTMTQTRTVRRGRTLSTNHLHRAALGDDRIFARNDRRAAPNTALHLLVDLSGSMQGYADQIALDAAMALALALEPMRGVSCAVTAFPSRQGCDHQVTRVLSHGDRLRSRAGAFIQGGRGSTPMTGALWYAAADLLARREARKVLLTLTDGDPDDRKSAKTMVDRASAAGLIMIGVGIATPVAGLFPVAIRIDSIADLKGQLFGIAEQLLLS